MKTSTTKTTSETPSESTNRGITPNVVFQSLKNMLDNARKLLGDTDWEKLVMMLDVEVSARYEQLNASAGKEMHGAD